MRRLLEAIRNGVPAAVFEDPLPYMMQHVTPTGAPKRTSGQALPKSNIRDMWNRLTYFGHGGGQWL